MPGDVFRWMGGPKSWGLSIFLGLAGAPASRLDSPPPLLPPSDRYPRRNWVIGVLLALGVVGAKDHGERDRGSAVVYIVHDISAVAVLASAGIARTASGGLLWPVVALHAILAVVSSTLCTPRKRQEPVRCCDVGRCHLGEPEGRSIRPPRPFPSGRSGGLQDRQLCRGGPRSRAP